MGFVMGFNRISGFEWVSVGWEGAVCVRGCDCMGCGGRCGDGGVWGTHGWALWGQGHVGRGHCGVRDVGPIDGHPGDGDGWDEDPMGHMGTVGMGVYGIKTPKDAMGTDPL